MAKHKPKHRVVTQADMLHFGVVLIVVLIVIAIILSLTS